jgi:hypothetical protein
LAHTSTLLHYWNRKDDFVFVKGLVYDSLASDGLRSEGNLLSRCMTAALVAPVQGYTASTINHVVTSAGSRTTHNRLQVSIGHCSRALLSEIKSVVQHNAPTRPTISRLGPRSYLGYRGRCRLYTSEPRLCTDCSTRILLSLALRLIT